MAAWLSDGTVRDVMYEGMAEKAEVEETVNGSSVGQLQLSGVVPFPLN